MKAAPAASDLIKTRSAQELTDGVPTDHRSLIVPTEGACKTILILPGLYESPYYMKGLTEYYKSRGFNVVSLVLSGHFRKNDPEMKKFRHTDWRADAEEGLKIAKSFGKKVYLLGYSTGGTLAADLALRHPSDVAGLFFFAPALDLTSRTYMMVKMGALIHFQPVESCNKEKLSLMCKAIAKMAAGGVSNARPLLAEGLSWSPYAGVQVAEYIQMIFQEGLGQVRPPRFPGDPESSEPQTQILADIYGQIRQPTFMVLDEGDRTVSTPFSKQVYKRLKGPKDLILYQEKDNISHTNITKYAQDAYKGSPEYYNHFTDELEKRMDRFIESSGGTCDP